MTTSTYLTTLSHVHVNVADIAILAGVHHVARHRPPITKHYKYTLLLYYIHYNIFTLCAQKFFK
jgi:hypothetical protein